MELLPGRYRTEAELLINAPARKVWQVLADFSAVDTWAPQVTRSHAIGTRDRGVGARRHCDIKGFGGIDEVVTEWVEGRTLTYAVTPVGPLGTSHNRWTVSDVDDGTSRIVVELGYDLRFGWLGRFLHALMVRRKLQAAIPKGPEALKRRVETGRLVRPRRGPENRPQRVEAS